MDSLQYNPPKKSVFGPPGTFLGVFCDFFKSYVSKPLTIRMFFVVLWEVVSPPRAIFDISTPDQENRTFRLQNEAYFGYFRMFCSAKYSKNVLWILRWPESRPKC